MAGEHGGVRPNSGRPRITEEQRALHAADKRRILIDELLFPALSAAFHCDPGRWQSRYLEVELSKDQITLAYGRDGLAEWMSFFSIAKIGGKDRFGHGYKTRWSLNFNKYGFIIKFLETLGHTVKDIPLVFFPPDAMKARLAVIEDRRSEKRLRRSAVPVFNKCHGISRKKSEPSSGSGSTMSISG